LVLLRTRGRRRREDPQRADRPSTSSRGRSGELKKSDSWRAQAQQRRARLGNFSGGPGGRWRVEGPGLAGGRWLNAARFDDLKGPGVFARPPVFFWAGVGRVETNRHEKQAIQALPCDLFHRWLGFETQGARGGGHRHRQDITAANRHPKPSLGNPGPRQARTSAPLAIFRSSCRAATPLCTGRLPPPD